MRSLRFATPLLFGSLLGLSTALVPLAQARAQLAIVISVNTPPPDLPVYAQPPMPAYGYIWAPGYWAWSDADADYYWVPGTWVQPPQPGLLWTPGYWGWNDGAYAWNPGYWAPNVGFYGGVNYGYGYAGDGYQGGYWQHGNFFYNRRVNNFGSVHVTNVYERNVTNITVNRISYNGGRGGIERQPSPQDLQVRQEHHYGRTQGQQQQEQMAAANRALFAHENHGVPPVAATARPAEFTGQYVEHARNAPEALPPQRPAGMSPPQHPDRAAPQPAPMPRPAQAMRPAEAPQPMQEAPRPMAAPRPMEAAPHPVQEPRPMEAAPRPMEAPHPVQAPRPMQAPHPEFNRPPAPEARPAPGGHDERKPG